MSVPLTVEFDVHFRHGRGRQKGIRQGRATPHPVREPGRVPRISRLMALAIRFEELIRTGQVAGYGELARLGRVSRARVSQIMNLLQLAPDIQEQLLGLPLINHGRDVIGLRQIQPIASELEWRKQRVMWKRVLLPADAEEK